MIFREGLEEVVLEEDVEPLSSSLESLVRNLLEERGSLLESPLSSSVFFFFMKGDLRSCKEESSLEPFLSKILSRPEERSVEDPFSENFSRIAEGFRKRSSAPTMVPPVPLGTTLPP